jgi:hypothetical protein
MQERRLLPYSPRHRPGRAKDDARSARAIAEQFAGARRAAVFVKQSRTRRIFRRMQRLEGARVA